MKKSFKAQGLSKSRSEVLTGETLTDEALIRETLCFERAYWERGHSRIAGVDEAGRGPLAGPVVAAAAMYRGGAMVDGIEDSKKLSPARREALFDAIQQQMDVGIAIIEPSRIDEINILQATLEAMRLAVADLKKVPDFVLVDGNQNPFSEGAETVIKGDSKCYSIKAASIVAKVTRDRLMLKYDQLYPEYGFARHKGYGTQFHREMIGRHGPTPIHRTSFRWG